ncbi:MAG: diguanylate cyclase [Nitrospirae bacterium]|nr:diguanylate cyclase [Nitrospirota bacterium]
MQYAELLSSLQNLGKDPSRLIFEDELTGLPNRRFLLNYLEQKVEWDALKEHPLSLLMMDLDHFKQINDAHGHLCGDQALAQVARLLKEVVGDQGVPIRYAGDEFMVLMPGWQKQNALKVGEDLLQRARAEPLHLEEGAKDLPYTFSIGVASAPEDAKDGKGLIQKADAALYFAKQSGRDRLANAADLTFQDVFGKAALHYLENANIVGRRRQLAQVADSFEKFRQGQSQVLIIEGAAGMGKSTFLDTIRRTLTRNEHQTVKVNGIQQEAFRPYYLATNVVVALLNQRQDKGAKVFEDLSSKEIAYLAHILPQLEASREVQLEEDETTQREGIFSTLIHFIPKLLDSRPLFVLIDDLQFADEASLLLFRRMMLRRDIPLFVCSTSTESVSAKIDEQVAPLDRFYLAFHRELDIRKIHLKPLTAADIGGHLRGLFPQVTVPEGFEENLAEISQGNPLFLGEILRKLVMDQKIVLTGQRWIVRRLEESYLPRSLEDIVSEKIAALDEESRQLLAQASTFGEDVSLSFLTGSSQKKEAEVEEFVDKAVALGLLSSDFQHNDETIRFLGKRVHEIAYGGIQEDQKQVLHERIGNYQENLYQQRLLPSASYLAYHFKRSANQEKAKTYEKLQAAHNAKVFDAEEAVSYSGELPDETEPDIPLDPASLPHIPVVTRGLLTAVRNIKLYPPESKSIADANLKLVEAIRLVLTKNERLHLAQEEHVFLVNGEEADVGEYKSVAEAFVGFLNSMELMGIAFRRGITEQELKAVLEAFAHFKPSETIDQRLWEHFCSQQNLVNIRLRQVRYTQRGARDEEPTHALLAEQKVEREDIGQIHEIIRCLLSSTRNIKLFPLKSQTITSSIEQLVEALHKFLSSRPSLTLARASESLLVNGEKIDTSEFKAVADGFMEFLKSIELNSLTFLGHPSAHEVETFISSLPQLPNGMGPEFWKGFAKERGITRILFNAYVYEVLVEPPSVDPGEESTEAEQPEQDTEEPFETFFETMPSRVSDLLLRGDTGVVQQMVARAFRDLQKRDPVVREKVVNVCRTALEKLPLGFKQDFTKLIADPLLLELGEETDSKIFGVIAINLRTMAENLIRFSEYLLASRIFSQLRRRHENLEETKDARAQKLAKILHGKLDLQMQKLVMDDLRSGDPTRQQNAAKLLGSMGRSAIPLLVDIVKQEKQLRVRQIAAGLLAELGAKAARALKSALVLEISPEERLRILEVIDTVSQALETELAFAISDKNAVIRQAAFRLAERLDDKAVAPLLMEFAASFDSAVAIGAIKCLGKLQPEGATELLVSVLTSTKETEKAVACCQALGQIKDPNSIESLAKILGQKGWFLVTKRWNGEVRGTAAYALRQIPDPRVAKVLKPLANDRDPRVKQIARTFVKR